MHNKYNYRLLISMGVFLALILFIQPMVSKAFAFGSGPYYLAGAFIMLAAAMGILGTKHNLENIDAYLNNTDSRLIEGKQLDFNFLRIWHVAIVLSVGIFGVVLMTDINASSLEIWFVVGLFTTIFISVIWDTWVVMRFGFGLKKTHYSRWREISGDIMLMVYAFVIYSILSITAFSNLEVGSFSNLLSIILFFSAAWSFYILPARFPYLLEQFARNQGRESMYWIIFKQLAVFVGLGLIPIVWRWIIG